MTKTPISIQKSALVRYTNLYNLLSIVTFWAMIYGLFVFVILIDDDGEFARSWIWIHAIWTIALAVGIDLLNRWISARYVDALEYEIDGDLLLVNQGVFNLQRQSIPLNRVTDIRMTQGILMRRENIWNVSVQTASMGTGIAEATLVGIGEPKAVRDMLLKARENAATS